MSTIPIIPYIDLQLISLNAPPPPATAVYLSYFPPDLDPGAFPGYLPGHFLLCFISKEVSSIFYSHINGFNCYPLCPPFPAHSYIPRFLGCDKYIWWPSFLNGSKDEYRSIYVLRPLFHNYLCSYFIHSSLEFTFSVCFFIVILKIKKQCSCLQQKKKYYIPFVFDELYYFEATAYFEIAH